MSKQPTFVQMLTALNLGSYMACIVFVCYIVYEWKVMVDGFFMKQYQVIYAIKSTYCLLHYFFMPRTRINYFLICCLPICAP